MSPFNPESWQPKNLSDLPDSERSKYEEVPEGGFVSNEAADELRKAEAAAKQVNSQRSWKDKLGGQGKISAADVLLEKAQQDNTVYDEQKGRSGELDAEKIAKSREATRVWENIQAKWAYYNMNELETENVMGGTKIADVLNAHEGIQQCANTINLLCLDNVRKHNGDIEKIMAEIELSGGKDWAENLRPLYEWLVEELPKEEKRAQAVSELKSRHPGNRLFELDFYSKARKSLHGDEPSDRDVDEELVFCAVDEKRLDSIDANGLHRDPERTQMLAASTGREMNKVKQVIDGIFDENGIAKPGYSRIKANFAVPDYRDHESSSAMAGMGEVVIGMLVDPDKALVVDAEDYNAIAEMVHDAGAAHNSTDHINEPVREEIRESARKYWGRAITLAEFRKLPYSEQRRRFQSPEILIPDDIPPERIKVEAVVQG